MLLFLDLRHKRNFLPYQTFDFESLLLVQQKSRRVSKTGGKDVTKNNNDRTLIQIGHDANTPRV